MFDLDRSAAHGLMSARKLIIFKHSSELGNAPANVLFDLVKVTQKSEVQVARAYDDYSVSIAKSRLPQGISIEELL